jgi:hypothetical protein
MCLWEQFEQQQKQTVIEILLKAAQGSEPEEEINK